MLRTPTLYRHELLDSLEDRIGEIEPGILLGGGNLHLRLWPMGGGEDYQRWPRTPLPSCYGVVDSPMQFLAKYREILVQDERTFVVSLRHVAKNPEGRGKRMGWRWHKWGPYLGEGKPACEYLDDEEGFPDGVCCYHIYQIDGPDLGHE